MANSTPADRDRIKPVPLVPLPERERPTLHLPVPLTSFVGRVWEVAAVVDLLRRRGVRLVTLTGPSGVGKTRLAVRVAEEVAVDFPDGAWFIPLAAVRDPTLVVATIARVLAVRETGSRTAADMVRDFLREHRVLLILDNFEHLLEAGPLIPDLLATSPGLTVLATSREVLRLSGEHAVAVPPFSLATNPSAPGVDASTASEAVRLFVERARAARDDFVLTDANASTVAAICERLDGLPLAIELAAVRIRHLPLPTVLARLEQRLPLLTSGARDVPARLRTMRDAVAWSYDLLMPEEQALFRRLATFEGGFDLAAAEAVAGAEGAGGEGSTDDSPPRCLAPSLPSVFEGIASLVDKSLLRQEEPGDGQPRYGMLETIREYGRERLVASGEEEGARRGHAIHYLAVAERAERELWGPAPGPPLDRLDGERDNVRAALTWALEQGEIELGLGLTAALWNFHVLRGQVSEARWWQTRLLTAATALPSLAHATALAVAGDLARMAGDHEAALVHLEDAIALARRAGDPLTLGKALYPRALAAEDLDDDAGQVALFTEMLALLQGRGATYWTIEALMGLGRAARKQADYGRALALHEEALGLARDRGCAVSTAWALTGLAEVAANAGEARRAAALFRDGARLHAAHGNHYGTSFSLLGLAKVAAAGGRSEAAARLLGAAEAQRESRGEALAPADRASHDACVATVRARLSDDAFGAAWVAGLALPLGDVVDEALRIEAPPPAAPADPSASLGLTPREREVLVLLAEGRSDREIADALFISPKTVGVHIANFLPKLGVPSRAAAVAYAHRRGLA
jgi:non-specific serine/threonine protein kinase